MPFPTNPSVNSTYNIGEKRYRWDGNSWTKISAISAPTSYIGNVAGDILPTLHNVYDFGTPTRRWRNLYVANTITSNNWSQLFTANVIESPNNLYFTNTRVGSYLSGFLQVNVIPSSNLTFSLGNTTNRFNQLFLSGNTSFTPSNSFISNATLSGTTFSQQFVESFNTITFAEGNVNHDFNLGATFYHSNINTNFTANFVNIPTLSNSSISIALILDQHASPYFANSIQINGVTPNIKYFNGNVQVTPSNINVQNFTLLNINNIWTALSSISSF